MLVTIYKCIKKLLILSLLSLKPNHNKLYVAAGKKWKKKTICHVFLFHLDYICFISSNFVGAARKINGLKENKEINMSSAWQRCKAKHSDTIVKVIFNYYPWKIPIVWCKHGSGDTLDWRWTEI